MTLRIQDTVGNAVGFIGIQLPFDMMNTGMTRQDGLGETGEVYLIGPDMKYRSDSRVEDRHHLLDITPDLRQATDSMNKLHNVYWDIPGLDNGSVLATTGTFVMAGIEWGVVLEKQVSGSTGRTCCKCQIRG